MMRRSQTLIQVAVVLLFLRIFLSFYRPKQIFKYSDPTDLNFTDPNDLNFTDSVTIGDLIVSPTITDKGVLVPSKVETKKQVTPIPPHNVVPLPQNQTDLQHVAILQKTYTMNNKNICNGTVHVLILVHTATTHFSSRAAIRSTFGSKTLFLPWQIRVVFLLGLTKNSSDQAAILKEERTHSDIVQGDFLDTYHNLTHKALMGFKWASEFCQNVQYVLKIDDDVIFDMHTFLRDYPKLPKNKTADVMCYIQHKARIQRSGKWAVHKGQFKGLTQYPWSYCYGFTVVMKLKTVKKLLNIAYTSPYFWIDDLYVYGMLRDRAKLSIGSMPSELSFSPFATTWCLDRTRHSCPYISRTVSSSNKVFVGKLWKKWIKAV